MSIVYLNDEYLDSKQAQISVMDRGFLFADGVYEVIPAYNGQYFRFEQHISRLNQSLAAIHLPLSISLANWQQIALRLLEANELVNATLYLQVTRGVDPVRQHLLTQSPKPTILAMVTPLPEIQLQANIKDLAAVVAVTAITRTDIRWHRCDIKSTSLLANCLLLQEALENGKDDTILVRNGYAVEATASNLFMVKGQQIITPPLDAEILAGVTREFVLWLAKELGFSTQERLISESELATADEIWLTSTNKEIRPVVELNDVNIGTGRAGPVWQQLFEAYQQLKNDLYQGFNPLS
ncbi:aminotransferase class IV [Kangiella sp. TOML190]|uniref:aminotransferase class IV n=1 Tax=Kangiella sp. TOML190 TaxID=2931351 RepID=UPI00203FA9CF|nr:aminotransferase class IV [Kangiella sp. TOML190]